MKKTIWIPLILILFACNNNSKRVYEKNAEGNLQYDEQINEFVIKRVVLNPNKVLTSVEYENTKKKYVVIYYYKNNKLDQSIKMSTTGTGFIENSLYSADGKVAEKLIKTQDKEKIATYRYGANGKVIRKNFFRTGRPDIHSFISYDNKENPVLTKGNSHFLNISKQGNELILKPAELGSKPFISASVFVVDSFKISQFDLDVIKVYKKNPKQYPYVLKQLNYDTNSVIRINLNELDVTKGLKCQFFIIDYVKDGIPNYLFYELSIPNLESIPSTNLYPIVE